MSARKVILVTAFTLSMAGFQSSGRADTFVIPLPVSGAYEPGTIAPFEFNLGVGLTEVHEIRFDVEGSMTAGLDYYGSPFSGAFTAGLYAEPGFWWAVGPEAGEGTWPLPEPFAGESAFTPYFRATRDFLLDGHAEGYVELGVYRGPPETPPRQYVSGFLNEASLIIEATPVPELATLLLLGLVAVTK